MQQQENLIQQFAQKFSASRRHVGVGAIERKLAHLDVPITELVPGKLIKNVRIVIETIAVDRVARLGYGEGEPRANPSFGEAEIAIVANGAVSAIRGAQIHL